MEIRMADQTGTTRASQRVFSAHRYQVGQCITFFFQAEDGILAGRVTGVQTCALPISDLRPRKRELQAHRSSGRSTLELGDQRSEERRVGKSVDLGGRRIIKKKQK